MTALIGTRSVAGGRAGSVVRDGRRGPVRQRLILQVSGCLLGVGVLQFAVRRLLPDPSSGGVQFVLSMGGDMLVAAGLAAAVCSMLRLLLPASLYVPAAAAASFGLLYLSVVASFLGIDFLGAATASRDAVLAVLLAGVLVVGLRAASRGPLTFPAGDGPVRGYAEERQRVSR